MHGMRAGANDDLELFLANVHKELKATDGDSIVVAKLKRLLRVLIS